MQLGTFFFDHELIEQALKVTMVFRIFFILAPDYFDLVPE